MAWEFAATGDQRGALMELDAAHVEARRAGWSEPVIDSNLGSVLLKLGRLSDAEPALSRALVIPPVCRVIVLCDLSRTYAATGDADAAAEALEEAYLLTRAERIPRAFPASSRRGPSSRPDARRGSSTTSCTAPD